ncbi:MAG: hypothetical protein H7Y17_12110 [Chlorobia bacterium]|nr:hypothetical protein [Fimbriimonadaceae bacterium]
MIALTLTAFGCSQPPKAVFVDLEGIYLSERPKELSSPDLNPLKSVAIPQSVSTLPRSPGVLILDKAAGKIDAARKLIEADRESAIRTLGRRLAAIRSDEIDLAKLRALEEFQEKQTAYLAKVYDQLFAIFEEYAKERGPKNARADFLVIRKPDLFVSRTRPTNFAQLQREEIVRLRTLVKQLDTEYDRKATQLLNDAQIQLSSDQGSLQAKYETLRANAIEQAAKDARAAIAKSGSPSDLNLGQNRSVAVSEVRGQTVVVPGSTKLASSLPELSQGPVVSETERRKSLDQQLEIWLKVNGFARAKTATNGNDLTKEFDSWRKVHRLGR